MAVNRYVGMRYVPLIVGEHTTERAYEALSIVTNNGASYTSKRDVPIGTALSNTDYWVMTGNYNAQVDYYREEVVTAVEHVDETASGLSEEFDTKTAQLETSFDNKIDELNDTFTEDITQLNNTFNTAIGEVDDERQQMVTDFNTAINAIPDKYYFNGTPYNAVRYNLCFDEIQGHYIPRTGQNNGTIDISLNLPFQPINSLTFLETLKQSVDNLSIYRGGFIDELTISYVTFDASHNTVTIFADYGGGSTETNVVFNKVIASFVKLTTPIT